MTPDEYSESRSLIDEAEDARAQIIGYFHERGLSVPPIAHAINALLKWQRQGNVVVIHSISGEGRLKAWVLNSENPKDREWLWELEQRPYRALQKIYDRARQRERNRSRE